MACEYCYNDSSALPYPIPPPPFFSNLRQERHTVIRSSRLVSLIPRYVVDFAFDCHISELAVDTFGDCLLVKYGNEGRGEEV